MTSRAVQLTQEMLVWISAGMPKSEDAEERVAVCKTCDNLHEGKCNVCGCYVTWKALLKTSHCPLGKW